MRSIWRGSIAFGLVNVPVKVYSATEDHDLKFHQVHAKDHGRIRYQRVCAECGEAVEYRDIAKAYQADNGQTVVITDDDIAGLPEERSHEIEVVEFVPASEIDPLMYDRSYFLEPDGKSSKSYVLLAKTLAEIDRVAIVHFALRSKTRLAALRVKHFSQREVMVVHTLLWPDEIRDPDFPALDADVQIRPAELTMAGQVVESMATDFHPEQFTDTYQDQLRELVQAKLAGGEAFSTADPPARLDETDDVSDLLAKLEASVRRRREQSGAAAEAPAPDAAQESAPAAPDPPDGGTTPTEKAPAKRAPAQKAPAKKAVVKKAVVKKAAEKAATRNPPTRKPSAPEAAGKK